MEIKGISISLYKGEDIKWRYVPTASHVLYTLS